MHGSAMLATCTFLISRLFPSCFSLAFGGRFSFLRGMIPFVALFHFLSHLFTIFVVLVSPPLLCSDDTCERRRDSMDAGYCPLLF